MGQKILDCENVESTYLSLCNILGVDQAFLDDYLVKMSKQLERIDSSNYKELFLQELNTLGIESIEYDGAHWFHATRVSEDTTFDAGLLPVHENVEHIWGNLYSIFSSTFSPESWNEFRKRFETNPTSKNTRPYKLKTRDSQGAGPFAFLIRDMIFEQENMLNHNYLGIPETVEDIILELELDTDNDLRQVYTDSTKATIVKFVTSNTSIDDVLTALYYLLCKKYDQELNMLHNIALDRKGVGIAPSQIIGVEKLDL